jgi:hypothetical protein
MTALADQIDNCPMPLPCLDLVAEILMKIDERKVDEISLALLYLTTFRTKGDSERGKATVGMFSIAA